MKRQRPPIEENLDEDFDDEQDDDQNQRDTTFQQKLLGEPVDVESLLQKLKNKKIQNEFGRGRPATFLAVLEKLLSLELQDEKQEAARYQALEDLAKIKMPRITKPEANYFLYCIGIKYAHRFSKHRELQAVFFGKMFAIKKGGEAILAAMQGNLPALEKLSKGGNLDYAKSHETKFPPLSLFATANNQPEVLRLLHEKRKPLRSDYMCLDPLFHAVAHGLNDLIPSFLEYLGLTFSSGFYYQFQHERKLNFISMDQYCLRSHYTPNFLIGVAASHGQLETVKLLQSRGYKDAIYLPSSIKTAAENKHFHIAEHLLSEIPSQENWDMEMVYAFFRLLTLLVLEKQEPLLQRLLKTFHKPPVTEETTNTTPLQYLLNAAIQEDHLEAFIWAEGLPIKFCEIHFQKALLAGSVQLLSYFINELITEENRSSTIYHQLLQLSVTAKQFPHLKKSLHHLAQLGFGLNFQDEQGSTLLIHFAHQNQGLVVQLLIELGADPSVRNVNNESAFDVCAGIDAAMALLKWEPSEKAESEPRPHTFTKESIDRFFKLAELEVKKTKNQDQFFRDFNNIMGISLQLIEEKFVLLEKADLNSLSHEEFTPQMPALSEMKTLKECKEITETVENKLLLLKLRYALKKVELGIIKLKSLSNNQTEDEEKQSETRKEANHYLLMGISANPLLFGEELRKLLQDYLRREDSESLEILLAFIFNLDESEIKSIVCRSLGEPLWEFNKHYAYLCCREAGKYDGNEALRATMLLVELMGVDAAWNISEAKLEERCPKEYAEAMRKIEEENKKFSLRPISNTYYDLLVHSAAQNNLTLIKTLFEQGHLSFEMLTRAYLKALDEAGSRNHYEVVAYLTVNAVESQLKQKRYVVNDHERSDTLIRYLRRPFISETSMTNEALTQMQSSLKQKHRLNHLIHGVLTDFRPIPPQNYDQKKVYFFAQHIPNLENFICSAYETADFLDQSLPFGFISLFNLVLVLAYNNNSSEQRNPSLQNIISFLMDKLVINPKNTALAILLNECTGDHKLKISRRLDLFNKLSETNHTSIEEFVQTSPCKLLSLNVYVRAVWCNLFGRENENPQERLMQLFTCEDSAQFWERYSSIKNGIDQFLDEHPRRWHRYELFSRLESACMLEFMKIQEKSLEALRKPAETGDLLEQSSPRTSSSPRLFRSRSSEDFDGAKRLPSTDPIPPDNSKQQKL